MGTYVMTNDQYEAAKRQKQLTEPKSDARMPLGLQVLGAVNKLATLGDKKPEPKAPDPNERVIVSTRAAGGREEVTEIYRGTLQEDGSLYVTQVKDAQFHYTRTNKEGIILPPEALAQPEAALPALKAWRKAIEHPPVPQAREGGYQIGGPYETGPKAPAPFEGQPQKGMGGRE